MSRSASLALGLLVPLLLIGGCSTESTTPLPDAEKPVATTRSPLPTYADAVARYNARIRPLDRLLARATIRLTYTDVNGEQRIEQPDGTLQIVRPRKLAIDLGKSGKKLFWFGSDESQYWWLDLSDSAERIAYVGDHAKFNISGGGPAAKRLGISVPPLDFIAATGIVLLDPAAKGGQTQWSRDGQRLGIIAPLRSGHGMGAVGAGGGGGSGGGGVQRLWVDPKTMVPISIELFDAQKRYILVAEHEGDERVEITRTGVPGSVGDRPRIPARITVKHFSSKTEIRVSLSDAKDGPIREDLAFNLDELVRRLGLQQVINLDRPQE